MQRSPQVRGGSHVRLVGEGSATLVASQAGDGEYEPAPDATQRLVVVRLQDVKAGRVTVRFGD